MSSSILDRPTPFLEADWTEFQTGTKHGVSEKSIQKDLGEASSNSSGSKSKEAQAAAGVTSAKYCCEICYGDHRDTCCSFRDYVPYGAVLSPLYSITCYSCGTVIGNDLKCPRCKPRPGCELRAIATSNACIYCGYYTHEEAACPRRPPIDRVPAPPIPVDQLVEPTSPIYYDD